MGHRAWHGNPALTAPRWVLAKIGFMVAQPGLDAAYHQHLVVLTRARRAVADVATSRKRLELEISELEAQTDDQPTPGITGQLAELRRQYAQLTAREKRVTDASRRLMAEIDAFRASKEATKATHTAAEEAAETFRAEVSR
jgi:phage shock protein A